MYADALACRIYYEAVGDGMPVVFVHGLGGTSNVWHPQRVGLSRSFKVVTLDLPGSGRSDRKETFYSMEKWADQLHAFADVLQLEKFVLVGHSMATVLAQKYAAKYGNRLHALVLCGPLTELPAAGKEAFLKRAETVLADGMPAIADAVLAGALTPATREANPALTGMCREMLMANDPASYAAQCHALINGSAAADQPLITSPTLVLVGDQDAVTPLSMARAIVANVRGAKLHVVPATAHLTMLERPEIFNAALIQFLAGL